MKTLDNRTASGRSSTKGPAGNVASLVSFIIPTHNYGRFLLEAINSALAQDYPNFELIVVDDGSTDNTPELMAPLQDRVWYIRQEQRGPSAARNAGIKAARGELIAFLDADDVWIAHKTRSQVSYLTAHPEVGLVSGRMAAMNEGGTDSTGTTPGGNRAGNRCPEDGIQVLPAGAAFAKLFLHQRNYIATSTAMLRRECLDDVGVFDESLRRVEDFNLWLRVGTRFALARLPDILGMHRYHGANLAQDSDAMRQAVFSNLERICALYPETASARRRVASSLYFKHGLQDLYGGRLYSARRNLRAAIRQHRLRSLAYPLLLVSCCPNSWLEAARSLKRTLARSFVAPARRGGSGTSPNQPHKARTGATVAAGKSRRKSAGHRILGL